MSRKTTDKSVAYKPFAFDWAFEAYNTQNRMHWLPENIPLHDDVSDWRVLEKGERELLTRIFRFFTQSDTDVEQAYIDRYMPIFKNNEIRMMLAAFTNMESIHQHAYSLLIDTVGLPETEYTEFMQIEAMAKKHEFIENVGFDPENDRSVAHSMAIYSAFTEGILLFSSFAILLSFQLQNKMKGMNQIVAYSVRDESLHVECMLRLYRTFVSERPHLQKNKVLEEDLYWACRQMIELEDTFIDFCFGEVKLKNLTKEEVKDYIRYVANARLIGLNLKPIYDDITEQPLPWLTAILNGVEHTNFFENRATEYGEGNLIGDWSNDMWGKGLEHFNLKWPTKQDHQVPREV